MKTRAAIAWKAGESLTVEEVDLDGPREGEVLVEVKATGICHTDEYTLSGADPEGIFPAILGHEGAGIVVDVGPGVRSNAVIRVGANRSSSASRQRDRKSARDRSNSSPAACGKAAPSAARGRTDVPKIIDWYMEGRLNIDDLITHQLPLDRISDGFALMRRGESIRSVVVY